MDLDDRMKMYEHAYRSRLPRRFPLIIRIDGKAFHTLTQGFDKPFDYNLIRWMNQTSIKLCQEV